jgi:hypothetical protein
MVDRWCFVRSRHALHRRVVRQHGRKERNDDIGEDDGEADDGLLVAEDDGERAAHQAFLSRGSRNT